MDKLSNYGDIPYAQNIRTLFSVKPLIMYCGRLDLQQKSGQLDKSHAAVFWLYISFSNSSIVL